MKRALTFTFFGVLSGLIPGAVMYGLVTGFWPQTPASHWLTYGAVVGLPAAFVSGVVDAFLERRRFANRPVVVGFIGLIVGFATLAWVKPIDLVIPAVIGMFCGVAAVIASWLSGRPWLPHERYDARATSEVSAYDKLAHGWITCPHCNGTGRIHSSACIRCDGKGEIEKENLLPSDARPRIPGEKQ